MDGRRSGEHKGAAGGAVGVRDEVETDEAETWKQIALLIAVLHSGRLHKWF